MSILAHHHASDPALWDSEDPVNAVATALVEAMNARSDQAATSHGIDTLQRTIPNPGVTIP